MCDLGEKPGGGVYVGLETGHVNRGFRVEVGAAFGECEFEFGGAAADAVVFGTRGGEGVGAGGVGWAQALGGVGRAGDYPLFVGVGVVVVFGDNAAVAVAVGNGVAVVVAIGTG